MLESARGAVKCQCCGALHVIGFDCVFCFVCMYVCNIKYYYYYYIYINIYIFIYNGSLG